MKTEIFSNESFGDVQTLQKGEITLFGAKDVAKALGYKNTNDAIKQHCEKAEILDLPHPQSKDKTIPTTMIPEGDIYRLIVKSTLPEAKKFGEWVFDKVLPSIRKTGKYEVDLENMPLLLQQSADALEENKKVVEKVKELAEITQEQAERTEAITEIGYEDLYGKVKGLFYKHNELAKQVMNHMMTGANGNTGSGANPILLERMDKMETILNGLKEFLLEGK